MSDVTSSHGVCSTKSWSRPFFVTLSAEEADSAPTLRDESAAQLGVEHNPILGLIFSIFELI